MADAKAYEIRTISEALRDSSDIPINYEQGTIAMDTKSFDEFVKRTRHRLAYQELMKQQRIESVYNQAYRLLEEEPDVPDTPVDPDWIIRLCNSVEDISSPKMQEIWAKVLANEVKTPGSFSLRTLNVLKNLTQKETALFERISPFVLQSSRDGEKTFDDCYILANTEIYKKHGITFPDIMIMDEAGLMSSAALVTMTFKFDAYTVERIIAMKKALIFESHPDASFSIPVFPLTEAGKELLPIMQCNYSSYSEDLYVKDCLLECQEHNSSGQVSINLVDI